MPYNKSAFGTYQSTLSDDEIVEKLENYEKVKNIKDVALKTHVRYFITNENGEKLFRIGGFLLKIDERENPRYCMLCNKLEPNGDLGGHRWSVQTNNATFWARISKYDQQKKEIDRQNETEEELLNEIEKLKRKIKKLEKK